MVLEDGGLDGGRDSQYQREDQDGDGHSDVNLSLPLHLSRHSCHCRGWLEREREGGEPLTCELEWDVAGERDETEWGEEVVEGEVESVEPAVVQAPGPAKPHIVLHEERRDKTAIGQVWDGHHENYWNIWRVTFLSNYFQACSLLLTIEFRFLLRMRIAMSTRFNINVKAMKIQVRISQTFLAPVSSTGSWGGSPEPTSDSDILTHCQSSVLSPQSSVLSPWSPLKMRNCNIWGPVFYSATVVGWAGLTGTGLHWHWHSHWHLALLTNWDSFINISKYFTARL